MKFLMMHTPILFIVLFTFLTIPVGVQAKEGRGDDLGFSFGLLKKEERTIQSSPSPTPSPSPLTTPSTTPRPTVLPSISPTPQPTTIPTSTPQPTPSPTLVPSTTPTPRPTASSTPTPSPTPESSQGGWTETYVYEPTPSPSPTPQPTSTPTPVPTPKPIVPAIVVPKPSPKVDVHEPPKPIEVPGLKLSEFILPPERGEEENISSQYDYPQPVSKTFNFVLSALGVNSLAIAGVLLRSGSL